MLAAHRGGTLAAVVSLTVLSACGGSGGGGGGLLPLLPADEFVALETPGTTSNEFVACHDGLRIYVAWAERSNIVPDAVFFSRSLDGGVTWLPTPTRISGLAADAGQIAICCDGERVYLAYRAFEGGQSLIRLDRSLDGGTTFLDSDVPVSPLIAASQGSTAICCEGLTVHVAWEDARDGAQDVRYNRSIDGGGTFPAPDRRLDTDTAGAASSRRIALCCDGPRVHAAWVDARGGTTAVRSNRSLDAGVSFLPADVLASHAGSSAGDTSDPSLACAGSTVVVAWSDERNGLGDIFANRSLDGGATFGATDVRVDTDAPGASISGDPAIALEAGVLHVIWGDLRGGAAQIRYSRSGNAGATFLAQDVEISEGPPGPNDIGRLTLAVSGDAVVAAWEEDRLPLDEQDIFVAVSTDGGDDFEERRVDTDAPGAALSFAPRLALEPGRLVVMWVDARSGDAEVRVNRTDD